jgi:hypothetical protein
MFLTFFPIVMRKDKCMTKIERNSTIYTMKEIMEAIIIFIIVFLELF